MRPTHLSPGVSWMSSVTAFGMWEFWAARTPQLNAGRAFLSRRHPLATYVLGEVFAQLWQPLTPAKELPLYLEGDALVLLSRWVTEVLSSLDGFRSLQTICAQDLHATRTAMIDIVRFIASFPLPEYAEADSGRPPGEDDRLDVEDAEDAEDAEDEADEGESDPDEEGDPEDEQYSELATYLRNALKDDSTGGQKAQARGAAQEALSAACAAASKVQKLCESLYGRSGAELGPAEQGADLTALIDEYLKNPKLQKLLDNMHLLHRVSRASADEPDRRPRPGPPVHAGFVSELMDADLEEKVALVFPPLKLLFLLKLLEQQFYGVVEEADEPVERGDLIVCLDCSGSMSSVWPLAQAFVAALATSAIKADQGIDACLFNAKAHNWFDSPRQSMAEVLLSILSAGTSGGTQIRQALKWTREKLEQSGVKMDVVVVTDGLDPGLRTEEIQALLDASGFLTVIGVGGTLGSWEGSALFTMASQTFHIPTANACVEVFSHALRARGATR